jgi:predicted kinase
MKLGNWLADKLLTSDIEYIMEDFCEKEKVAKFISENTNGVGGFKADDDGPRYFWGDQASYKKATKQQAERLGMKVLDYISGNEEVFNLDKETKFPNGPTGAVSYFPVGLPGVRSGTNLLKDKKGRSAYNRWKSWSKYIATHLGWKLVSYMGAEISIPQTKKEPTKATAFDLSPKLNEILLNEGLNDKHIFKAIFLAGGPGSGKSSVVDAIFNNPDQAQVKSLTSTGLKVVNLDRAYEYLKAKHKLPVDAEEMTDEENSLSGKLMYKARMIAQKQMDFYLEGKLGIIIDGTGGSYNPIAKKKQMLEDLGYDCYMIFVDTTMKTAMERNSARDERRLLDKIVKRSWKSVQKNKKAYKSLFGNNIKVVSTEGRQPGELPRGAKSHVMKFINNAIQNPIAKKWIGIAKKVLK